MIGDQPYSFSIDALNRADENQAAAIMDRIVERSAWLAHRAAAARPFRDVDDLSSWLEAEVRGLAKDEAIQLLCAHPELSPPDPQLMTHASQREQGRLHLLGPDEELATKLADLNRRYIRRHGYPFVIALHAHSDLADVIAQFEERLAADHDQELIRSLGEVVSVMTARLAEASGCDATAKPGALSTRKAGHAMP
jgi:OHCU decarboxylase